MSFFTDLLEKYRIPLMAICLPFSYVYGCYTAALKCIRRWLTARDHTHEDRVRRISEVLQARAKLPESQRKKIVTDRSSTDALSLSFLDKSNMCRVPTSALNNVLSLDEKSLTVTVEPFVSVEEAAQYLVPRGYMLASHLEYGRATLGGLAMAVGMTTHAHHTGLLQETVVSYEIVLADGSVLDRVTEDGPHRELFRALPWSHGTLGMLAALELKIIPVKKYVRLRYIPVNGGVEQMAEAMRKTCGALDPAQRGIPTFCEATLFSKDRCVITTANFDDGKIDGGRTPINSLARWYKPWWYRHVEGYSERNEAGEELVPVGDYILRHTRSIFWVIELMVPYGNHPLFRWLLGWILPLDPTFMKMTTTPGVRELQVQKQVFQDITLPMTDLERAVDLCAEVFDVWPILIYPCKEFAHAPGTGGQLRSPKPHQLCPGTEKTNKPWGMFFDIGIYGVPGYVLRKEPGFNPTKAMQKYVEFVMEVGGHPFLYADHWFGDEEFEKLFDLTLWRQCRKKYKGDGNFPTIWEKVRPEVDVIGMGDVELFTERSTKGGNRAAGTLLGKELCQKAD